MWEALNRQLKVLIEQRLISPTQGILPVGNIKLEMHHLFFCESSAWWLTLQSLGIATFLITWVDSFK